LAVILAMQDSKQELIPALNPVLTITVKAGFKAGINSYSIT
jgi:hypothetical protein